MKYNPQNIPRVAIATALVLAFSMTASAQISSSLHDFSGSGWAGGEICAPCHTPHNEIDAAGAPLWNHLVSTEAFVAYTSTTMDATAGVPSGTSLLCLSCHDGATAMDNYGGVTTGTNLMTGNSVVGVDLGSNHPISIAYSDGGAGLNAEAGVASLLSGGVGGTVECSSCHDPHNDANVANMLVMSNAGSALCLTCHDK